MRDLVAEIQRSVGYYKSLSQAVKFEEILVTGEGYKLFGLDRFLAEQLQYQIAPIQELKNFVYQGDPERAKDLGPALPSLGVAIGLALQGLGRAQATINLLPEDFIIRRELRAKRFTGLVAAALIWGIVGCFWAKEKAAWANMSTLENAGETTLAAVDALNKKLTDAEAGEDPERLQDVPGLRDPPGILCAHYRRHFRRDSPGIRGGRVQNCSAGRAALPRPPPARRVAPAERRRMNRPEVERRAGNARRAVEPHPHGSWRPPGDKEPTELTVELPQQLKKARIYPDQIEFIKGIVVDRPNARMKAASHGAAARGRPREPARSSLPALRSG